VRQRSPCRAARRIPRCRGAPGLGRQGRRGLRPRRHGRGRRRGPHCGPLLLRSQWAAGGPAARGSQGADDGRGRSHGPPSSRFTSGFLWRFLLRGGRRRERRTGPTDSCVAACCTAAADMIAVAALAKATWAHSLQSHKNRLCETSSLSEQGWGSSESTQPSGRRSGFGQVREGQMANRARDGDSAARRLGWQTAKARPTSARPAAQDGGPGSAPAA
jgi:hypothetical protein